jgi:uncharacterized membrane protein
MFRRSRTDAVKHNAAAAADLAAVLAADKKFRKQVVAAADHGVRAKRRAASGIGLLALASRLAADEELRTEMRETARNVEGAWSRLLEKRPQRSHRVRTTLLTLLGIAGVVASLPRLRALLAGHLPAASGPRTIEAEIEVDVPVTTAYNQWTQFEEFPQFMEGVEEVRQLDDTLLHWVATVGGTRNEWDAKILEQHPDRQISWVSEDGKKTRGTVTFEPLGDSRSRIHLSMGYQAEGVREALGSAAGPDARRVRGDLGRFKELIEERGTESGAWRGDVSAGSTR